MTSSPSAVRLIGGVVSYQDGPLLDRAIASLAAQDLPDGTRWTEIRVAVVQGDTPALERAKLWAERDPRVRIVVEPMRRGKSSALHRILANDGGDYFVLLNGDAEASPQSVRALLSSAGGQPSPLPLAIMGRPVQRPERLGRLGTALDLLWELHHQYHARGLAVGATRHPHLSDELLLLSAGHRPVIPRGVVNDGSFLALEVLERRGRIGYAPEALVWTEPPKSWGALLQQRRRIHWGNHQVATIFGRPPGGFVRFLLDDPREGIRTLWATLRGRKFPLVTLFLLGAIESAAALLARLDSQRHRSYVQWARVTAPRPVPPSSAERKEKAHKSP